MTDWDLWGPPTHFVSEECDYSYYLHGQNHQFYYDQRWDVIEQEALNRMSRSQVMKIMVDNSDLEIKDLEGELALWLSKLVRIENEEWFALHCSALKDEMKSLQTSIISILKNEDRNDDELLSPPNAPPVDASQEITKDLLQNMKDDQPASAYNNEVEDIHCVSAQIDKRVIQNSSSQEADEEHAIEIVDFQNAAINAVSSTRKTPGPLIGYAKRNKRLSSSVVSKNVERHSSISAADILIIEDSPSKPAGRNTNIGKVTKSANAVSEDFGSIISRQSTMHSMKIIGQDDVEVVEIKDSEENHSRDTKSGILISYSNPRGKGNDERTDKSADGIVNNVVAVLRCPTDLYGRKVKADSGSSTFDLSRSSNMDLDQKICEFAPLRKLMTKGSKTLATPNIYSSSSHQQLGVKKSSPTSSFSGPHEHKSTNAAELQVKKEDTTEETKFSVTATDETCCNWIVPYNPRKVKQTAEPQHTYSISKGKKRLQPSMSIVNASLNNPCRDIVLPRNFEHGVPSDMTDFEKLRVPELRLIAKQCQVKQYYKLNKQRLLVELANKKRLVEELANFTVTD